MNYTSSIRFLGHPLIQVNTSALVDGKIVRGVARAWIAIGDIAIGRLLAIGGVSMGGISIGGVGLGVVSVSGVGVGLLSFAGLAISALLSWGGLAVSGGWANGGLAIGGYSATGGLAIGFHHVEGGRTMMLGSAADDETAEQGDVDRTP